ncbi:hypothetical protein N9L71_09885 [Verrucomicrobiales bacterium]|nr:hypothetical protein [Verrucomicrobiales bacterium]
MIEIAESMFSYKYSDYAAYEEYFYRNLDENEFAYIEPVWKRFQEELNDEKMCTCDAFDEYEGVFFEQVDYIFIFLFKIYLPKPKLTNFISSLLHLKEIQGDDFCVIQNHMTEYFSPSWSGEDKSQILDRLDIGKVEWPPQIGRTNGRT